MKKPLKEILIGKINKSKWWHVTPSDPKAYKSRGKFLASTYSQADFYGRPNDRPETVNIQNPIYATSENTILRKLFPKNYTKIIQKYLMKDKNWYKYRIALDSKMYSRAKYLGYDAIIILGNNGINYLRRNRKPHSIELNLLYPYGQ